MSNISIKVNLRQFKHVVKELKGKNGDKVKCLVLPIAENHFFEGEKGIYIDLIAFKFKGRGNDRKDTHIIKQSFAKEFFEKLTDEQKKELPIIGNARYWSAEVEPNESNNIFDDEDEDDLPF